MSSFLQLGRGIQMQVYLLTLLTVISEIRLKQNTTAQNILIHVTTFKYV